MEPGTELWSACQADIIRLLKGETIKHGRASVTRVYRSLEGFDALADALRSVAEASGRAWTDEDSWDALESVVTAVADDDRSRRGLLAAKIFLGYRATPGEDDPVPMCDEAIAHAEQKRGGRFYTLALIRETEGSVPADAPFEESITVREAFAAPMFSPTSATPSTFRSDRTPASKSIREVADALLIALVGHISEKVAMAATADDAVADQPEATGWRQWLRMKIRDYYSEGYPHPNQYWRPIRTGEALVDHLEGKRLRIEYRNRAITRADYDAARDELKRRRRAREG